MNRSAAHLETFKEQAEAAAATASEHIDAAQEHLENSTSGLYTKRSRPIRAAGYYAKYARVSPTQSRKPIVAAGLVALAATTAVGAFALRRTRTTGAVADEE